MKFYPKHIYYPLESVLKKYEKGELNKVVVNLYDFVERHKENIIVLANEKKDMPIDQALIDATEDVILKRGTLNPALSMANEIKEIQNETWYDGEKGEIDSKASKEKWQDEYEIQWAEARIFEDIVVLDQEKLKVLEILKADFA